jgi:hypothetical protein
MVAFDCPSTGSGRTVVVFYSRSGAENAEVFCCKHTSFFSFRAWRLGESLLAIFPDSASLHPGYGSSVKQWHESPVFVK